MNIRKIIATVFFMIFGFCLSNAILAGECVEPDYIDYKTSGVYVRITALGECSGEPFLYQAWNAPKRIGQGKPDWVMKGGKSVIKNGQYSKVFKKGNTVFHITDFCENLNCDNATLDVYVSGKKKKHYFLRNISEY